MRKNATICLTQTEDMMKRDPSIMDKYIRKVQLVATSLTC